MKNRFTFCLCLLIIVSLLLQLESLAAGTTEYKYSTILLKKTKNTRPAIPAGRYKYAVPAFEWDGYDTLNMNNNEFQKVEFRVFDSSASAPNYALNEALYTYPDIMIGTPDFTYESRTGAMSYILKGIASTRKKLVVRLYLNGYIDSAYETKHFYTTQPGYKSNGAIPTAPPPLGTVLPYMGGDTADDLLDLEQSGWLLCDGRLIDDLSNEVLNSSEKDEFKAMLTRAGNPDATHIPDLRGYFMRGADRGTGRDPDVASRAGSSSKIGSTQDEQFKSHTHDGSTSSASSNTGSASGFVSLSPTYTQLNDSTAGNNGPNVLTGVSVASDSHSHSLSSTSGSASSTSTGGNETRPKNVYVNYIIKARW